MREELRREVDRYGDVRYYNKDGNLHRLDGPAIELSAGYKAWWQNGELHRLNGPAVEFASGTKEWWQNGELHRLDGPAVELSSGTKAWWIEGKYYRTEEEWLDARCPSIEEAREMFKDLHT